MARLTLQTGNSLRARLLVIPLPDRDALAALDRGKAARSSLREAVYTTAPLRPSAAATVLAVSMSLPGASPSSLSSAASRL